MPLVLHRLLQELVWRFRCFVWRNFLFITAVWLLVVGFVGVRVTSTCRASYDEPRALFGSIHWVVPDFGDGP